MSDFDTAVILRRYFTRVIYRIKLDSHRASIGFNFEQWEKRPIPLDDLIYPEDAITIQAMRESGDRWIPYLLLFTYFRPSRYTQFNVPWLSTWYSNMKYSSLPDMMLKFRVTNAVINRERHTIDFMFFPCWSNPAFARFTNIFPPDAFQKYDMLEVFKNAETQEACTIKLNLISILENDTRKIDFLKAAKGSPELLKEMFWRFRPLGFKTEPPYEILMERVRYLKSLLAVYISSDIGFYTTELLHRRYLKKRHPICDMLALMARMSAHKEAPASDYVKIFKYLAEASKPGVHVPGFFMTGTPAFTYEEPPQY